MTVLINVYGSAGAGKSTTALGLTHFLKMKGHKVEYVSEYAKDLVNEGSEHKLKHQLYVFAKQLKRLDVVMDKGLDFVVTDSPLLLSYFYGLKYKTIKPYFKEVIAEHMDDYDCINIFIKRDIDFDPLLRVQSAEESDKDSVDLLELLSDFKVNHISSTSSKANTTEWLNNLYNSCLRVQEEVDKIYTNNKKIIHGFLQSSIASISVREELLKNGYTDYPTISLGRRQGNSTSVAEFIKENPDLNICVVSKDLTTFHLKNSISTFISSIEGGMFNGKDFDLIIIEPHIFSGRSLTHYIPKRLLSRVVFVGS